jgi:hypothetical protein
VNKTKLTLNQKEVLTDYLDSGFWFGNKDDLDQRKAYFDFYTKYVRNVGVRNGIEPQSINIIMKDKCIETRNGFEVRKKIILMNSLGEEVSF